VAEGTPIFPYEAIVEVTAPIGLAQLVETLVVNEISPQTVLASKAARIVAAAAGRAVIDFGARRAQGREAAGARAFAVAGAASTSLLAAGECYGIPVAGTMAHGFVPAFDDEVDAFATFAEIYSGHRAAGRHLRYAGGGSESDRARPAGGRRLPPDRRATRFWRSRRAIARSARMLDEAGLHEDRRERRPQRNTDRRAGKGRRAHRCFRGGHRHERLGQRARARRCLLSHRIRGFRTDEALGQEGDDARLQAGFPADRQRFGRRRRDETHDGTALLECVMRGGKRTKERESLDAIRQRSAAMIAALPLGAPSLDRAGEAYPVVVSDWLAADAAVLGARLGRVSRGGTQ